MAQGPLLRRRRAPQEGLGARVVAVLAQGVVPERERLGGTVHMVGYPGEGA